MYDLTNKNTYVFKTKRKNIGNILLTWKVNLKVLIILCWNSTYLNTDVEADTIFILNYPRAKNL